MEILKICRIFKCLLPPPRRCYCHDRLSFSLLTGLSKYLWLALPEKSDDGSWSNLDPINLDHGLERKKSRFSPFSYYYGPFVHMHTLSSLWMSRLII